ncbi:MAG: hypothetical protein ACREQQ_13315, partial [Candidatus Binatia bacterium]
MATAYRVRVRNIATKSENKIHDDSVARRYGFQGGLVPGVVVYGYLVHPVVARLGERWLAAGRSTVRFLEPCYEGEEILVRALEPDAAREGAVDLVGERSDGTVLARGQALSVSAGPGDDGTP